MHTKFYFLLIILAGHFAGCKKNEPVKPVEQPKPTRTTGTLQLEGVTSDTVSNAISVKLDAQSTKKVEVFMDDTLVSTYDKAPFNVSLNTLKYEDGAHQLKLNVTGNDQNIKELSKKIYIDNTLISIYESEVENISADSSYYVLADEEGNILNEIARRKDLKVLKIKAKQPLEKEYFNVFQISQFGLRRNAVGYAHLKKGSSWDKRESSFPNYRLDFNGKTFIVKPNSKLLADIREPGLGGVISTNDEWSSFPTEYPLNSQFVYLTYSEKSKVFFEIELGSKVYYNFFDIPEGKNEVQLDPDQLTETPVSHTVDLPSTGGYLSIYGIPDIKKLQRFRLFWKKLAGASTYFLPKEPFDKYQTLFQAKKGKLDYFTYYSGDVPKKVDLYEGTLQVNNLTLKNFDVDLPRKFSFTKTVYSNAASSNNLIFTVYNTRNSLKLPDLKKMPLLRTLDVATVKPTGIQVFQVDNFRGDMLPYIDDSWAISTMFQGKVIRMSLDRDPFLPL